LDSAAFFARITAHTLNGDSPSAAIQLALDTDLKNVSIADLVEAGLETRGMDTRKTIGDFGQMCSVGAALPATVHLIVSYENDLKTALVKNVLAGGDSAARGMLVGMVLGAYRGMEAIPPEWIGGLKAGKQIFSLLDG
jgi:ADP-ribosylglycohydrolase